MRDEDMSISQKIRAYHGSIVADEHHRYRSWEHCFQFFSRVSPDEVRRHRDAAALQLGFYLASWGMYRGSSFLLQRAYTAHLRVVDCLACPRFLPLWRTDFGSSEQDSALVASVLCAADAVREAYIPFGRATDTLVTKVLLGTLGCLPACDRYFLAGFKIRGYSNFRMTASFIERLLLFCASNITELQTEQERIKHMSGITYPLMKLVDMYFWQVGSESGSGRPTTTDGTMGRKRRAYVRS
jgi:hypothetical protein